MGLLDQIKQGAGLPPGPITAQGLMSGEEASGLMNLPQMQYKRDRQKKPDTKHPSIRRFENIWKSGGHGEKLLSTLAPEFAEPMSGAVKEIYDKEGIMIYPYKAYRSPKQQQAEVDEGDSEARPYQSSHQFGLGLDIVVLNKDSNNPDPLTIKKNDLDWGGKNNKSDYKKIGKYLDKYGLQNLGWVKNPHHKDRVTDKKSPHYDMYEFGDYGHIMPKGWEKSEALTDYLYHKTPDFEHKIRTGRGNISTRVPIFQ